jgi:phosphoribosyl 1,2-cyclic phosphate phosphodiesterase
MLYSHWHPDHVAGRRVFETNYNYSEGLTAARTTPIYIPSRVADDFKERMAIWENLEFLQSRELIKLHVLAEGDSVQIGDVKVTPFPLAESYVYAFLLESSQGQRALLAPDELYGWTPPDTLGELDVAIIPIGLMEHDPFTGERRLPEGFLERIREMNFNQSLQVARSIPAKTVYFSHIEEPEGMSFVDYQRLEQKLASEGTPVRFAYDMQRIEV